MAYCTDADLTYDRYRRMFVPGDRLDFDTRYRFAHLPLVAPGHRLALSQAPTDRYPGLDYVDGRYARARYALTVPIAWATLARSAGFQAMEQTLRDGPLAPKISWAMTDRRRDLVHATLKAGFAAGELTAVADRLGRAVQAIGPINIQIKGPYVGQLNQGRIYLPLYPARVAGRDGLAQLQAAIGVPETGLYLAGLYHLTDPLDAAETAALAQLIGDWRDDVLAEVTIPYYEIHETHDDLTLDSRPVVHVDGATGAVSCPHPIPLPSAGEGAM